MPKFEKNTTVARVLPGSTASTGSPSRRRVVRQILHFLLPLHPAVARHDHDGVFLDDEVVLGELDVGVVGGKRGAPRVRLRVGVRLLNRGDLVAHDVPAVLFAAEQARDLARALALLGELVGDDEDLEPREPVDLQLEDRVGLRVVQLKRAMIFAAASALPSDLRTIFRISSSASKTFSKPSRM